MGVGMGRMIVALFAGTLFGLGLAISGMMNPAKIIGFLDITVPAFRLILNRPRPILADGFALPTKSALDVRLLGGAALFGVGWGLSQFCPGPAVAALVTGLTPVFAFVAAMMAGMVHYALLFERPDRSNVRAEPAKPEGLSRP